MRQSSVFARILALFVLPSALAIRYSLTDGNTQFIYYNGSISGSFVHSSSTTNASACGDGGTYYFSDLTNSSLRIGTNAPWDTNPFFFEFARDGDNFLNRRRSSLSHQLSPRSLAGSLTEGDGLRSREEHLLKRQSYCFNFLGGCTTDAIFNLHFSSTRFECFRETGKRCGFLETSWYYAHASMVDLGLASIGRVSDASIVEGETGTFYAARGDEKSWVNNDTTIEWNKFDFQRPGNYSEEDGCVEEARFVWNASTPFIYALNFTNTTATARFTVTAPVGSVTLLFTGRRQDGNNDELAPNNSPGQYSAIALANPANNTLPKFTFTNGTEIVWTQVSANVWTARSSAGNTSPAWAAVVALGMACLGLVIL